MLGAQPREGAKHSLRLSNSGLALPCACFSARCLITVYELVSTSYFLRESPESSVLLSEWIPTKRKGCGALSGRSHFAKRRSPPSGRSHFYSGKANGTPSTWLPLAHLEILKKCSRISDLLSASQHLPITVYSSISKVLAKWTEPFLLGPAVHRQPGYRWRCFL